MLDIQTRVHTPSSFGSGLGCCLDFGVCGMEDNVAVDDGLWGSTTSMLHSSPAKTSRAWNVAF